MNCVFVFQAGVQMQESLQQHVEPVISLLEEANQHNLPAFLIHKATQLQVLYVVFIFL